MVNLHEAIGSIIKEEAALDLILVYANKPVNYTHRHDFSYNELWKIAKSFARARNHSQEAIGAAIQKIQEAAMYERLPDPIGLVDIDVSDQGLSGSALYYAHERHLQDLLFKQCSDRIQQSVDDTLGIPIEKARQRECQIAQVYLQYLNDILFHDQSIAGIAIDVDKFKHYYDKIYEREMPPTITRNLIMEVLQMARLGYEYDARFYPFWYTARKEVGQKFRKMLSESIAARCS